MDANFKLKRKDRSIKDPELAPGWAFFVEETHFQEHIKSYMDQPEVRITLYTLATIILIDYYRLILATLSTMQLSVPLFVDCLDIA